MCVRTGTFHLRYPFLPPGNVNSEKAGSKGKLVWLGTLLPSKHGVSASLGLAESLVRLLSFPLNINIQNKL